MGILDTPLTSIGLKGADTNQGTRSDGLHLSNIGSAIVRDKFRDFIISKSW